MVELALAGNVRAADSLTRLLIGVRPSGALADIAQLDVVGVDPGAPWEEEAALVANLMASDDPRVKAQLDARDPGGVRRRELGLMDYQPPPRPA
jgi:hypothetical protein